MNCVSVYPLLSPVQCQKLLARIDALPAVAPNSMNRYGKVLEGPEWSRWIDKLVTVEVAPVARRCYGLRLKSKGHYAFVVEYEPGKQKSLAEHFDSSDVTLNVCLGRRFSGGDLVFTDGKRSELAIPQVVGRAVIHHGRHLHRARPLHSGRRTNLIVWCKATGGQA